MKTAIYFDEGNIQLVFTPESDFEKSIADKMEDINPEDIKIFKGHFYPCQGGWIRHSEHEQDSIILRIEKTKND